LVGVVQPLLFEGGRISYWVREGIWILSHLLKQSKIVPFGRLLYLTPYYIPYIDTHIFSMII